VMDKCLFQGSP